MYGALDDMSDNSAPVDFGDNTDVYSGGGSFPSTFNDQGNFSDQTLVNAILPGRSTLTGSDVSTLPAIPALSGGFGPNDDLLPGLSDGNGSTLQSVAGALSGVVASIIGGGDASTNGTGMLNPSGAGYTATGQPVAGNVGFTSGGGGVGVGSTIGNAASSALSSISAYLPMILVGLGVFVLLKMFKVIK